MDCPVRRNVAADALVVARVAAELALLLVLPVPVVAMVGVAVVVMVACSTLVAELSTWSVVLPALGLAWSSLTSLRRRAVAHVPRILVHP